MQKVQVKLFQSRFYVSGNYFPPFRAHIAYFMAYQILFISLINVVSIARCGRRQTLTFLYRIASSTV